MVNDLRGLMRQNVAAPPPDRLDPDALVRAGRRRIRGRSALAAGTAAGLVVAGVVAVTVLTQPSGARRTAPVDGPPAPDAPTLRLSDARPAVPGRDFQVLASTTNKNLDRDNGHYYDGVTDDGRILFRDGPRADRPDVRMALVDPATGDKDWLPDSGVGQSQTRPVELGTDRLVLLGAEGGMETHLVAHVFDRGARRWRSIQWPTLPSVDGPRGIVGPDGRLYVPVAATLGTPPPGGWPTGSDGEADDADADGDTYRLWSVSLLEPNDVRDESLTVGDVAFTDSSMVWTDSTNGHAGRVHTRDLSSGEERSFDPHAGKRCNLLSFGATDDRVVLGQYCGTYAKGVRDDRVQVLTSAGDQVVTLQGSDLQGALAGTGGASDLVTVTSYAEKQGGTYVYDLRSGRLLRVSRAMSRWDLGGPAPDRQFLWSTPVNRGHGATQWLGRLDD